ncbi:MAG: response regulator transcription factor [Saprospiraceae bacterium]|nr:response regulator transcription factor [Saprospiraceae bacterium]
MEFLKAVIIDDEELSRKNVEKLLDTFCPDVQVKAQFDSSLSAVEFLRVTDIDVLFLDISMPIVNGFEFLEALPFERTFEVIFVTAYDEYVLKALRAGAVDYILKPISVKELQEAVSKVKVKRRTKNDSVLSRKLSVSHSKGVSIVDYDNILYFEVNDDLTTIHLINSQKVYVSKSLKDFQSVLDGSFYRIHKSYLINLAHIQGYTQQEGGQAILKNNVKLPISRRTMGEFVETLKNFVKTV